MKKNILRFLCLIMVLAVSFSLVACNSNEAGSKAETSATAAGSTQEKTASSNNSSNSGEKVTLKVYAQYSSDDEKQPYDYALQYMKGVLPNVELELDIMAQDDNQKIKTYAASGNLPDIFAVSGDLIASFKKSNNLLQLDSYADKFNVKTKLNPSSISLLQDTDGHIYAIPNVGQWAANLYINKEVFTKCNVKIPGNYTELLEAVKTFRTKGITPLSLFAKEKLPGVQLFDMIASREEPKGIVGLSTGETKITDEAYKHAADKIVELVKAGLISKDAFNTSADQASAAFFGGQAAMFLNGSWSMAEIGSDKNLGDKADILYAVPFANADKAEATKWVMSGGGFNQGFSVSSNSKNKDIAAEYAVQFSLAFAEGRVLKRGDPNPIMVNPPKPEAGYNTIQQKYVSDSANFKSMTAYTWGITNANIKVALEDGVQKLLTGQYAVDQFINDIVNAVQ